VLIPTCRDTIEDMHLEAVLTGLAMQSILPRRIYVFDEGKIETFRQNGTRMLWNLIARKGVEVLYIRSIARKGVAIARQELFKAIKDEQLILYLDDDILLEQDAISKLLSVIDSDNSLGFVQGQKVELDTTRMYLNDINQLRGQDDLIEDTFPIFFGDAALLLVRRQALSDINWDVVTKYYLEGLPGEDVAMTLMIADKYPCLGVPTSRGWHISPTKERWRWEPSSDLLQIEQLKKIVSKKTLKTAFPHLRNLI